MEKISIDLLELLSKLSKERERRELLDLLKEIPAEEVNPPRAENE